MILIDTSAWVDFFRGSGRFANAVDHLIDSAEAALCGPVETELRRGIKGSNEAATVLELLSACPSLETPEALWKEAGDLGRLAGRKGYTIKTLDLLIATIALTHGVPVLTADGDFALLRKAGVPLLLADP